MKKIVSGYQVSVCLSVCFSMNKNMKMFLIVVIKNSDWRKYSTDKNLNKLIH